MQVCYSPELRSTNKDSTSFRNSGAYTSPGTPEYRDTHGGGFQKGWYSERVPLPSNSSRRRISAHVLMPFNSGRTLPSKWDDAERWITSPVSGSGVCKALAPPPQRRPKSKSGPLGVTPGAAYFSNYSPVLPGLEGGGKKDFIAGSPLTTGVLVPNGLSYHHAFPAHTEYGGDQSASVPGWSELLIESSYADFQDDKINKNGLSRVISRRDMATQMSPVDSPETSPKGRPPLSTSPPAIPSPVEPHGHRRLEVRDVQVDKGVSVTMTKQPKRHATRVKKNGSTEIKNLSFSWNTTEGAMELSKIEKEEARIAAWENLQNAKAEASIRKLEMKLEKKKSASMDKIMNKLRVAQMKAQEMRGNMSRRAANEAARTSHKVVFLRKYAKISLNGFCFCFHHS